MAYAATFENCRRRQNLSFSHHTEVCHIRNLIIQNRFLDWAEAENATVMALRAKVQGYEFRKNLNAAVWEGRVINLNTFCREKHA